MRYSPEPHAEHWKAVHIATGRILALQCDDPQHVSELAQIDAHSRRTGLAGPWRIECPDGAFVHKGLTREQIEGSGAQRTDTSAA